jgi:hypothetical protein
MTNSPIKCTREKHHWFVTPEKTIFLVRQMVRERVVLCPEDEKFFQDPKKGASQE